jgi:NADPH:quinone reductase-like Zn-dependent oxidoreductase
MSAATYPVSFDLEGPETMSRAHVFLRILLLILVSWIAGSGGGVGLVYLLVPVVAAILIARQDGDRYLAEDGARVTGWLAVIVGVLAYLALLTDELPGDTRRSVHFEIVRSGSPTAGSALWRIVKAIPSAFVLFLISLISSIVALIAAISILVTEHYPESLWKPTRRRLLGSATPFLPRITRRDLPALFAFSVKHRTAADRADPIIERRTERPMKKPTFDHKTPPAPPIHGTNTMQAIVQRTYDSADVLHLEEINRPTIGDEEVLVRVHAAGLDRGTWHLMAGLPYLFRLVGPGLRKPKSPVPGLDVAGTVVAVGAAVTRFQVGDDVFGISKGSFAEYACAREDKLALKPARLTFDQAAVLGVSGLTALQGLCDVGRLEERQHVLIVGASGGVGTLAVQVAKAFGAEVTGVCSTAKMDLVRSIGADHVFDYTKDDFAHGSQRYDLIFDLGGNSPLSRLRRALTPGGTLVIVGGEAGGRFTGGFGRSLRAVALSPLVRQRLTMKTPKEHYADLERLAQLSDAGKIAPIIDSTYPLHLAADAMRHLEAGHARGKIVISLTDAG